jgi:anaerobic magnesium-protoporphyrin IX monomethyl ester cyclase
MEKNNANFLIITHTLATGPSQELRGFFASNKENFAFIEHPFSVNKIDKRSKVTLYEKGEIKSVRRGAKIKGLEIFYFIRDFFYTIYFVATSGKKFDVCIAADNLNAYSAWFLKITGKIGKLVYWTIDYSPVRFENNLLNKVYHLIDRFCCYRADLIWSSSERARGARVKNGMNIKKMAPEIIVRDGCHFKEIRRQEEGKMNRFRLVFMGHLIKNKGVELIIRTLPELIRSFPQVTLTIIGSGEEEENLKNLAKSMGLEEKVDFTGFIKEHKDVEKIIAQCGLAIAPYVPDPNNLTFFSDVGKVRIYLACGLPVVITNVPEIAKEIEEMKAGIIFEYNEKDLFNKLSVLLRDKELYSNYHRNAIEFVRQLDWKNIWNEAMKKTLDRLNPDKMADYVESELIFCSFVPVGLDDYADYFIKNFKRVVYLKWKFPHSKGNISSEIIKYQEGKKISEKKLFSLPTLSNKFFYFSILPVNYLIYFAQSIICLRKIRKNEKRIFFGINYFCTFCGIILKKIDRVDFVIYRVMDFFPLPPKGAYRILNRIFYAIDEFCLKNADSIWFTTEGHIIGRENYGYFDRKKYNYLMIPLGINPEKFSIAPASTDNPSLVYCGVISKYHSLDLLFSVLKELKNRFENIQLKIIGSGPDEEYFKNLAKKMGLDESIVFYGFLEEGEILRKTISESNLGVALYKDEENFMKYTEPAKVKFYLSFGIPSIISDVPVIAKEMHETGVSFKVKNEKEEIVRVIEDFLKDVEKQKACKQKIAEFIKEVNINNLLDRYFKKTFESQMDINISDSGGKKILILNLPGLVVKAGSRWYNTTKKEGANLVYYPYPWFMGYLTSLLKKNGFQAKLIDAVAMEWSADRTRRYVEKWKPDYIICEPTWNSLDDDRKIIDSFEKRIKKIAVGNYATNFPHQCLEKSGVDFVVAGEYEFSILEFLKSEGRVLPKNFISPEKKEYQNPDLVDINDFPYPERNDTPLKYYNEPSCWGKNIVIVSSRGCRFNCSFCNVECIYGRHLYRMRNPKDVVDEIEYLKKNYEFDELYFDDDNMVAKKEHIDEICKEIIKRKLKISWLCMGDGRVDDETLELLSRAGCSCYKFGLEHFDEAVLEAIPKPLTKKRSLGIIEKCRKLKMRSYVNLIVGLPQSSYNKDLELLKDVFQAKPDLIQISIAIPYPGTRFFETAKEKKWLISEDPSFFDATGKSPVSYLDYPAEKIQEVFSLGWKMWYHQVLFHQPRTLYFFISSEIRRNGLVNTSKKIIFYFIKLLKNN